MFGEHRGERAGDNVAIFAKRTDFGMTVSCHRQLLQFCVPRLVMLQDQDVGFGIFPENEEVFVGSK